jgi:UDP-N-acetylmuramate dehydrogenase
VNALDQLLERGGDRVKAHAPLGARTTYRVGGSVFAFVTLSNPADLAELGPLLLACEVPVIGIGNGSNLLVNEGEHALIAVQLAGTFAELSWRDEGDAVMVNAGGGHDLPIAARRLAGEGIVDFEWAVGVPGTFGGALAMNAGGHGSDMAASVVDATVWSNGTERSWPLGDLDLGYRQSALDGGDLVLQVTLRLHRGDATTAKEQIRDIVRWRREHQPGGANGGSVFRNPPGDHAARLIDEAGLKGLRRGTAWISEKHANFIQVDVDGRAGDVFALTQMVRERVREHAGVTLLSENRYLGFGEQV